MAWAAPSGAEAHPPADRAAQERVQLVGGGVDPGRHQVVPRGRGDGAAVQPEGGHHPLAGRVGDIDLHVPAAGGHTQIADELDRLLARPRRKDSKLALATSSRNLRRAALSVS